MEQKLRCDISIGQTFRSSATNTESPRKSYVPYSSEMAVTLAEPLTQNMKMESSMLRSVFYWN